MTPLACLQEQFQSHVSLKEKRPGVLQLFAPLYHEDGDMVDIFLRAPAEPVTPESLVSISDYGSTLMRLSYGFELDTPNKERIFQRIVAENGMEENDGVLEMKTPMRSLYPSILQFAQGVTKVCDLRLLKREVLTGLFDEMLEEFIHSKLEAYGARRAVTPIPDRDDLEADWELTVADKPFYVFSVKDNAKARLAALSCLEFQSHGLRFKSVVVHEDFDSLSRKDRKRITSACEKQFISLDDFQTNAEKYFEREKIWS